MASTLDSMLALAAAAVPVAAVFTSLLFAVSPLGTVREIQRSRSTKHFAFAPFFFYFVQSVIFSVYAYIVRSTVMAGTSSFGALCGFYYVSVYCSHAPNKAAPLRLVAFAFSIVAALAAYALSLASTDDAKLVIGVPGTALAMLTSASPLLEAKTVIKKQDASSMPFGMSVMTVVASGVWCTYGMMLNDSLTTYQNAFSTTMGLLQVALILRYPGRKAATKPKTE